MDVETLPHPVLLDSFSSYFGARVYIVYLIDLKCFPINIERGKGTNVKKRERIADTHFFHPSFAPFLRTEL